MPHDRSILLAPARSAHPSFTRGRASRAALALMLASGLLVGACGGEDPLVDAVRSATRSLNALTAGGQQYPEDEAARRKALGEIQAKVRSVSPEGGSPAQQAGIALVSARVAQALGDLDAQQASMLESQSLAKVGQMRALLRRYVAESANAAASAQFNPVEQIEKNRAEIAKRQQAITTAQNTHDALAKEIDTLKEKGAALARQASGKRDEAAGIRAAAQGQSQAAQLTAVERAAVFASSASRLDTEAALIAADVAARTPVLDEQAKGIEAIREEARRLEAGVVELQARQKLASDLVAGSQAAARESATALSTALGEIEALRAGDLEKFTSSALTNYQASTAAARKAPPGLKGDDAGALKLAAAMAQQGEGDTLLIKARGLSALAGVLKSASEATPAMPDQSALAAAASTYEEQAKAALESARDAIGRASEAYTSVGGMKGPMIKERAEYAAATLAWIKAGDMSAPRPVMGGSPAPAGEAGSASASSGGAVAGDSPEQAAVRAALQRTIDATKTGDMAAVMALFNPKNDAERAFITTFAGLGTAMSRLDQACTAKLGKSFKEITAGSPMASAFGKLGGRATNESAASLKIEMKSPTEAAVTSPDGEVQVLRLIDGQWKMDLPADMLAGMDQMGPMVKTMADVLSALAGEVESGAITSSEQLMGAMMQKMQQLAPGGGRGPG